MAVKDSSTAQSGSIEEKTKVLHQSDKLDKAKTYYLQNKALGNRYYI